MTLSEKVFDTLWKSKIQRYPSVEITDDDMIEFAVFFEMPDLEFIFYFRMTQYEAECLVEDVLELSRGERNFNYHYVIDDLENNWNLIAEQQRDWTLDLILNGDLYPGKTEIQ